MTAFVILHYMATDCTLKCVQTIKALDGDSAVVIVDNASPDGSGEDLAGQFDDDPRVSVLLNSENSGFAKGNNFGVSYAWEKLDPDFVVVLNNDIEIEQSDFVSRIERIYAEHPFDLLGPDIMSMFSGTHQSPKRLTGYDLEGVRRHAEYVRRAQNPVLMFLSSGQKSCAPLWKASLRRRRERTGIDFAASAEGVVLQGACVIFSHRYLERRPLPFYSGTFMYFEMEILDWLCRQDGSVVRYDPSITVKHLQHCATGTCYRSMYKRSRFVTDCLLQSLSCAEALMLGAQFDAAAPVAAFQFTFHPAFLTGPLPLASSE